jgi:hypothetical protein
MDATKTNGTLDGTVGWVDAKDSQDKMTEKQRDWCTLYRQESKGTKVMGSIDLILVLEPVAGILDRQDWRGVFKPYLYL